MDITKLLGSTDGIVSPAYTEGNASTVLVLIYLDSFVSASNLDVVDMGISSISSLLLCKLGCRFKSYCSL